MEQLRQRKQTQKMLMGDKPMPLSWSTVVVFCFFHYSASANLALCDRLQEYSLPHQENTSDATSSAKL